MRVTIVGAGFSGSTLATFLASSQDDAPQVCLAGIADTFARGVAYGEARPEHLLNVRAGQLGADPDDPGGFADWLKLEQRERDGFLPRAAYGEYLAERLRAARRRATNLTLVEQEVVAINAVGDGFRVHLDDGRYFASDRVVLALGALPPQRLAGIGPRLAHSARYIAWPWQDDALARIEPTARVLIVGTGLTMADVSASLLAQGHSGPLVAISRHGLLPRRHPSTPLAPIELPPSVQQALRARDVRALLRAMRSLAHVVQDWRAAIDALRPHTQRFWRELGAEQRERFLRHCRSHWEVARHRIAPKAADQLEALQASGRLTVRAARLLRASLREGSAEVLLRERGREQAQLERYDYVIRATGLDTDILRTTHPLASYLYETGLIDADPHGLGMRVDESLQVLGRYGQPVAGLHCLGPLLRGHSWEITAVPELRAAARALARKLQEDVMASGAAARRRPAGGLERELALSAGT